MFFSKFQRLVIFSSVPTTPGRRTHWPWSRAVPPRPNHGLYGKSTVNGKDDIPFLEMENKSHVWNHQVTKQWIVKKWIFDGNLGKGAKIWVLEILNQRSKDMIEKWLIGYFGVKYYLAYWGWFKAVGKSMNPVKWDWIGICCTTWLIW